MPIDQVNSKLSVPQESDSVPVPKMEMCPFLCDINWINYCAFYSPPPPHDCIKRDLSYSHKFNRKFGYSKPSPMRIYLLQKNDHGLPGQIPNEASGLS